MHPVYEHTCHARERSRTRRIPPAVAELILEFGESRNAGGGAQRYALTRGSMRDLRRMLHRDLLDTLEPYRRRNAYVIAAGPRIVTVAFASHPTHD